MQLINLFEYPKSLRFSAKWIFLLLVLIFWVPLGDHRAGVCFYSGTGSGGVQELLPRSIVSNWVSYFVGCSAMAHCQTTNQLVSNDAFGERMPYRSWESSIDEISIPKKPVPIQSYGTKCTVCETQCLQYIWALCNHAILKQNLNVHHIFLNCWKILSLSMLIKFVVESDQTLYKDF